MKERLRDPDPVRWFEELGRCSCGKSATGTLRGPRNDSYGVSCKRCAEKRLSKARKERELFEEELKQGGLK